jgi:hypothetical protein
MDLDRPKLAATELKSHMTAAVAENPIGWRVTLGSAVVLLMISATLLTVAIHVAGTWGVFSDNYYHVLASKSRDSAQAILVGGFIILAVFRFS